METQLFHIFRNTPLGRETLLQSIYFCKKIGASPAIYIPKFTKFLMYFENDVVQVDLDESYLTAPNSALTMQPNCFCKGDLIRNSWSQRIIQRQRFPTYRQISISCAVPAASATCLQRSVSAISDPRVRRIVTSARFPVLMSSSVYKPWKSIAVFFGGSVNAVKALRLGFRISRVSGMPLDVFTQAENRNREDYEKIIHEENLEEDMALYADNWHIFENGKFEENLYEGAHDSLAILGALGHGLIKDIVFGSKMEKIHSVISNNLLIVGPKYAAIT